MKDSIQGQESDNYSSKWIRETKMPSAECARLLCEEIESLMYDSGVFLGQYNMLMNHYKKLSREVITA